MMDLICTGFAALFFAISWKLVRLMDGGGAR